MRTRSAGAEGRGGPPAERALADIRTTLSFGHGGRVVSGSGQRSGGALFPEHLPGNRLQRGDELGHDPGIGEAQFVDERRVDRHRPAFAHRSKEIGVQAHERAPTVLRIGRRLDRTPLAKASHRGGDVALRKTRPRSDRADRAVRMLPDVFQDQADPARKTRRRRARGRDRTLPDLHQTPPQAVEVETIHISDDTSLEMVSAGLSDVQGNGCAITAWISGSHPRSKMRTLSSGASRAPSRSCSSSRGVRMFRLANALKTRSQPIAKWSTNSSRPRGRRTRPTSFSPAAWLAQW